MLIIRLFNTSNNNTQNELTRTFSGISFVCFLIGIVVQPVSKMTTNHQQVTTNGRKQPQVTYKRPQITTNHHQTITNHQPQTTKKQPQTTRSNISFSYLRTQ